MFFIAEIRQKLRECESDLSRMGEARDSPKAQRYFVIQFCQEMQKMAEASLRGQYQDVPSVDPKIILRYLVQGQLDHFYEKMAIPDNMSILFSDYQRYLKILSDKSSDPKVREEQMKSAPRIYSEIYEEAKISEGRRLPGTVHPDVEEGIFRKQSTGRELHKVSLKMSRIW
ncbi:hypothetical protein BO71DRAFT_481634 [Aspergillus ellipticus CBS 707.79]|uniref:Uncharacterized protein n=1 Tax=Aspergillus ellipticus CBS 707.79 TaxID=1448320 RepID=A0A319DHJ0_9EURO|nr:hypothetical protein BO71DRAFT_481634 [Aspergillus ellipticus CBS 707.79]